MSCTTNNFDSLDSDFNILSFRFTSNNSNLEEQILPEDIRKVLGHLSVGNFKSSPYFFAGTNFKPDNTSISESEIELIKNNSTVYFTILESFISFLWLIKDNCCSINTFYTHFVEEKKMLLNNSAVNYFTAEGERNKKVSFSTEELQRALELFVNCSLTFHHKNIKVGPIDSTIELINQINLTTFDHTKITRIERAFNFLKLARSTSDLPQKIAFYICIYESLFYGNSSGEIIHQIAERVALYASNTRVFRRRIYQQIKDAYKIRSSYFHGNRINKSSEQLLPISIGLDSLTRNVLCNVVKKDSKVFLQEDKLLEESFKDLLFEDERTPDGLTIEMGITHLRFKN